jgi:hypothetical protein
MTEHPPPPEAGRQRSLLILAGSLVVCLFWIFSSQVNMYRYAVTGALAEIAWFPFIALNLFLIVLACMSWAKQKFRLQSLYLLSLLFIAGTFTAIALM